MYSPDLPDSPLICSIDELPPELTAAISSNDKAYIAKQKTSGRLPFAVTPHFASLALPDACDPILRQFIPSASEDVIDPFALYDPLGESCHRAAPRLIHQYRNRALLLAAAACAGFCRHCFRRVWISQSAVKGAAAFCGASLGSAYCDYQSGEWKVAFEYLKAHPEINEVLVSGGDPLTLDNGKLQELFFALKKARPGVTIRLCTRAPITLPSRLDEETIALLASFSPLWLSLHINHVRELSPQSRAVLTACLKSGIRVKTQTVLLRGVNDDAALLAGLFSRSVELGLSPYYLFQLDLAHGTAHFRVPLRRGLAIYKELGSLISSPTLPVYAVDLPGGGGKIALHENVITGERTTEKGDEFLLKDPLGREWYYPME